MRRVLVAWLLVAGCTQPDRVTILHLNDVYEIAPVGGRGGFAPMLTLLEEERRKATHHLTVFGGDLLSPSVLSGLTRGAHMIELATLLGVDVAVLGNHEFDFGPEVLRERIAASRFPWLGSNVRGPDGKPFGGAVDTWVRKVGELRLGFFGVTTPEAASVSRTGELRFEAPQVAAARAVRALRAEGVDAVIALSHLRLAEDLALVRAVRGIDLVLGGHDHEPIALVEQGTLIFKAGSDAHWLGAVDLAFSRGGKGVRVRVAGWRTRSTAGVAPHAALSVRVAALERKLGAALGTVVGRTAVPLDTRNDAVRTGESAFGNLVADAMRAAIGADVSLLNAGSIRGNRIYPAGAALTRGDLLRELPFGNLVVALSLTGAQVRAALENSVSRVEGKAGRFAQVSGLSFRYDRARPPGARVLEVRVGGAPLEAGRAYRVATTEFTAAGGDGYAFRAARRLVGARSAALLVNVVVDHVVAQRSVSPRVEGRIVEAGPGKP
jgi:2',3'-cyclic-nucleotide 2'-phosphodiesterase (5'-nucleotidase family)